MGADASEAGGLAALLLDQADRLFAQHAGRAVLAAADRGTWPEALWDAAEAAGFPLALAAEDRGGVGLGRREAGLLVRRSAYHTVPIPLAETIVANALWTEAGGEAVAGTVTLAPTNARDRLSVRSAPGGGASLSGTALRVPWGGGAGHVLVRATDEAGAGRLCLVAGGRAAAQPFRNLAHEPRDTLVFEDVMLAADAVRPAGDLSADDMLAHGAAMRAQQLAGAMARCLDHALAYAGERSQFGRALAKFQAVQHMLAVAAGQLAAATAAADALLEARDGAELAFAAAVGKARTGEAAGQVAAICHQVHAAMGFTQEHPLHFATRRLWSWRDEFGAEAFWQARIGRLVCARGGAALWTTVTGEWAA